ncbi:MAG: TolC family protein [Syntrophobacteraceae bacterium]
MRINFHLFALTIWGLLSFCQPYSAFAGRSPGGENNQDHRVQAVPGEKILLGDAIALALQANPTVKILEEKVNQSKGNLQAATGQFDWTAFAAASYLEEKLPLDSASLLAARLSGIDEHISNGIVVYSLSATKQFRSGISVSPSVINTDFNTNTDLLPPISRSGVNFSITIPLMRGYGEENTGAIELAAKEDLAATRLNSKQAIASVVLGTAIDFWNCLASTMTLELTEDTMLRAERLLSMVEKMVQAGTLEPASLNQAKAKLYGNKADLTDGRNNLYVNKQALAVDMGFTSENIANAPDLSGKFPEIPSSSAIKSKDPSKYIEIALGSRADYEAMKINIKKAVILLAKARNDAKPQLDLDASLGYAGLNDSGRNDRFIKSLTNNVTGLNTFVSLSLALPIQNNTAKGNIHLRASQVREAQLLLNQLSNNISSSVLVSYNSLRSAMEGYQLSSRAEEAYKLAVNHEAQKYRSGLSNLTNVIDIEDRYFKARISTIEAMRKYAVALAQFRFNTGTLLESDDDRITLKSQSLLELPEFM